MNIRIARRAGHLALILIALGIALGRSAALSADPGSPGQHDHDHDHARHALARGEIQPLAEILTRVAAQVPGEVIEVEFERLKSERAAGRWAYELKIIAPDGRIRELLVDAASGRILDVEEDD